VVADQQPATRVKYQTSRSWLDCYLRPFR
jgi:hypothetical protein